MKDPETLRVAEPVPGKDPINLTQVLKLAGWAMTGGEAKSLIAEGRIRVNGEVELRKRRKMAIGDLVAMEGGPRVRLAGPPPDPSSSDSQVGPSSVS
ncbi:MAG: RNA-binding S4 domain-containing protein [Isosphaeraceae bacterium]